MQSELEKPTDYKFHYIMPNILSQTNLNLNLLDLKTPQKYILTSIFEINPKNYHDFSESNIFKPICSEASKNLAPTHLLLYLPIKSQHLGK